MKALVELRKLKIENGKCADTIGKAEPPLEL
ncbi:hypothetical protein JOC78_002298 [Bacillus ectoiniformans]|nr:hypothetical protein [Bacillus ectoiniformans]